MPTYKYWCWTLNNWTPAELLMIRETVPGTCRYVCWQQEVGESGTPHLQGYIEFKQKKSMAWMKLNGFPNRTHFEARQASREAAKNYTKKPETAVEGTWEEHGVWLAVEAGGGAEIATMVSMIKEGKNDGAILDVMPEAYFRHYRAIAAVRAVVWAKRTTQPTIRVFWGATGTGKTRAAVDWATENGHDYHIQHLPKWWNGYEQQPVAILDEWGPDKCASMGITYVLGLLDRYAFQVETKGGMVQFNSPHVFITSNMEPDGWFPGISGEHREALFRRLSEIREFR